MSSAYAQQPRAYASPHAVIIQTPYAAPQPSPVNTRYAAKASIVCGSVQLTIGILLILLNIAGIALQAFQATSGYGISCGIFFIITGAFGLAAGKVRTMCPIVTSLVLSILSALTCLSVLGYGLVGVVCDSFDGYRDWDDDSSSDSSEYWHGGWSSSSEEYERANCRGDWDEDDLPESSWKARVAISSTMVILAAIEGIVAIVSSGLGCAGSCNCCCYTPPTSGAVITTNQYLAQPAPVGYAMAPPPTQPLPGTVAVQPNGDTVGETQAPPEYVVTDEKQALV